MKFKVTFSVLMSSALAIIMTSQRDAFSNEKSRREEQIKRGEYLVQYGGCHDCHSPKVMTPQGPHPDPDRILSGYPADSKLPKLPEGILGPDKWGAVANNDLTAWYGPWGVSYAANLTPDKQTGIGSWTAELFIKSMRTGKHFGEGRDILPPMPWYSLAALTDEDLTAIFIYLGTIKPIKNLVPAPVPPKH